MTARENPAGPTTGDLLSDAMTSVSSLVRSEVDLARAEISASIRSAVRAIITMVTGVVLGLTALNMLALFCAALLVRWGLEPLWSALAVGVVLAIVAAALAMTAVSRLKHLSIAPSRAARNVRRDGEAVMEAYNDK
jgi:uncharacterized membrane protein YqjE